MGLPISFCEVIIVIMIIIMRVIIMKKDQFRLGKSFEMVLIEMILC